MTTGRDPINMGKGSIVPVNAYTSNPRWLWSGVGDRFFQNRGLGDGGWG